MIIILYKQNTFNIPYDPKKTLGEIKNIISTMVNVPSKQLSLFYNTASLKNDHLVISELMPDNSTITVLEEQPNPMFNNPMVMNMINDPKVLNSVFDMFPDFKKEIEKNGALNDMMKSGELQEEMKKMMSDPDYYKEQMRNAELAMSKIQNMPGGMNILSGLQGGLMTPMNSKNTYNNINPGVENRNPVVEPIGNPTSGENLFFKYVQELKILREAGFKDPMKNVNALKSCDGDVYEAMLLLAEKNE